MLYLGCKWQRAVQRWAKYIYLYFFTLSVLLPLLSLYRIVIHTTAIYKTVLYSNALYWTVPYYSVLDWTVLYCSELENLPDLRPGWPRDRSLGAGYPIYPWVQQIMHWTAPYWIAFLCTALHCTALDCTKLHFITLDCPALFCSVKNIWPHPRNWFFSKSGTSCFTCLTS